MLTRCATRSCCLASDRTIDILLPKRIRRIRVSSSASSLSPTSFSSSLPEDQPQPSWLRRDLAIVLVHPQIPQNAGSAARTAAATRVPLHLVGPLGFEVSDARLKRAGLDYWNSVVLKVWPDWSAFEQWVSSSFDSSSCSSSLSSSSPEGEKASSSLKSSRPRFVAFSKRGNVHYATPGIYGSPTPTNPTFLLFGAETTGLPPEAHRASAAVVRLPIDQREVRSLNLAVSVGVGVYEALRQVDGTDSLPDIG